MFSAKLKRTMTSMALVGAALIRLEGGDPTLSDGLSIANERFWQILGYAAIAATVGSRSTPT